nr:hypothetical protein [uncultured Acetatifactor sp.]
MAKMEDDRIGRRKQMEEERKLDALRRQEQIEAEKRKEDEHNAKVRDFAESVMARKAAKVKAAEMAKEEMERQQEIYDRIDDLMKISTRSAEVYIKAMKEAGAL